MAGDFSTGFSASCCRATAAFEARFDGSRSATLALLLVLVQACVTSREVVSTIHVGEAGASELPSSFELLCWNVHKQRHRDFAAEFERFSEGVELVLVQEAVEAGPPWPSADGSLAWTMVVAFELGRARTATGVATGSAARVVAESASHSPGHEPFTDTPKSALAITVRLDLGGELMIVNLHGLNFRPARWLDDQLRALDPALADHSGPLVVAGDFNTWSARRRKVVDRFVARHQLAPAFVGPARPRLDAVYVRGLAVRSAEVLASRSSDHDALRVEFELAEPTRVSATRPGSPVSTPRSDR